MAHFYKAQIILINLAAPLEPRLLVILIFLQPSISSLLGHIMAMMIFLYKDSLTLTSSIKKKE